MLGPMSSVPVGVVLAGGRSRRLGGAKASALLAGRPLLSYPLRALRDAVGEAVVVAKPSTVLPALDPDVAVWREPASPSHPLVGIVEALRRAGGRAVLVCAGDMPFVSAALLTRLAAIDAGSAPAVVAGSAGAPSGNAGSGGRLQPLLARYEPAALGLLAPAAAQAVAPAREVVAALAPVVVPVEDPRALFNVNTPDDLREAETLLVRCTG
jgi:molybdopterin-guanine dinucleotide biosynthesis protein A